MNNSTLWAPIGEKTYSAVLISIYIYELGGRRERESEMSCCLTFYPPFPNNLSYHDIQALPGHRLEDWFVTWLATFLWAELCERRWNMTRRVIKNAQASGSRGVWGGPALSDRPKSSAGPGGRTVAQDWQGGLCVMTSGWLEWGIMGVLEGQTLAVCEWRKRAATGPARCSPGSWVQTDLSLWFDRDWRGMSVSVASALSQCEPQLQKYLRKSVRRERPLNRESLNYLETSDRSPEPWHELLWMRWSIITQHFVPELISFFALFLSPKIHKKWGRSLEWTPQQALSHFTWS